ncbi:MAG: PqqD family protein [bacterium]
MDLSDRRVKKNDNIAWRIIEEEALLVSPKDSLIYPLNNVGTRVWELLNGEKTCKDIIDIINEEFEGEKTEINEDILDFIKKLTDNGLASLI